MAINSIFRVVQTQFITRSTRITNVTQRCPSDGNMQGTDVC